jgi:acyl dehydratase
MSFPLVPLSNARSMIGREIVSDWMTVDQARIDGFARSTGDDYWIHTDPGRAARESPYGGAIAHGFLTLSLLTDLYYRSVRPPSEEATGVNYGLDKVRFMAPVKAGDRVRARFVLSEVDERTPGRVMFLFNCTVEVEGQEKPALIAAWRNLYLLPETDGKPALTAQGRTAAEERRAREAEALRDNLKRRKEQARAREG